MNTLLQNIIKASLLFLPLLLVVVSASAANDTSALRPPPGSPVALIVFEDLQCPDCARAAPLLAEAARTYKIPLVRHDFPLPQHNWSFQAAVYARYFDTRSKKLGNGFREDIFRDQPSITADGLRAYAEKYAVAHRIKLPVLIDPNKKLEEKVKADFALGQRIGLEHTPTIYVVSRKTTGQPFIEVVDRSKLFLMIEEMQRGAK